jgi:hypothetical protein
MYGETPEMVFKPGEPLRKSAEAEAEPKSERKSEPEKTLTAAERSDLLKKYRAGLTCDATLTTQALRSLRPPPAAAHR